MNITLESDSVTIASDLNEKVSEALIKIKGNNANRKPGENDELIDKLNEEHMSELRLYYVATTRAKIELINATQLPKIALMD